jgi:hypothetical protein
MRDSKRECQSVRSALFLIVPRELITFRLRSIRSAMHRQITTLLPVVSVISFGMLASNKMKDTGSALVQPSCVEFQ